MNNKPQIPKSVLDMKFMRKTKERIEKERQNVEDHNSLYSNIITSDMRQASGNFITESSFIFCEELLDGRLSFKGMNPEIERLMEQETEIINKDMDKDVPDDILVKKMAAFHKRKQLQSTPCKHPAAKKKRV